MSAIFMYPFLSVDHFWDRAFSQPSNQDLVKSRKLGLRLKLGLGLALVLELGFSLGLGVRLELELQYFPTLV